MEGWGWQSVHDARNLAHVLERWEDAISSAQPFEMVVPIKGADGVFRPFLTRINPAFDEHGAVTNWFGVNTDISLQVQAEDAFAKSETRFRTLADAMPQMVWSASPTGFLDYHNARWYEFTGAPVGATDGHGWTAIRPFDVRFAYHTNVRPLWNEPRPELAARIFPGNGFIVTRLRARRPDEGVPIVWTTSLASYHLLDPNSHPLPMFSTIGNGNLSNPARAWLANLGLPRPDQEPSIARLPWEHTLAIAYSPAWLEDNGDDIRQDWPRIPLPNNALLLRASAELGARVAALLEPETPVPGVTAGTIDPALALIAVPTTQGSRPMAEADRAITAGWGHGGRGEAVMPGRGRLAERDYAPDEAATAAHSAELGEKTCDVFLNGQAYWRNVPESVWNFRIGGYQVIKKFLSYREYSLLGRALTPAEIRYIRDVARRLAAIRLLGPELDANYRACAAAHYPMSSETSVG